MITRRSRSKKIAFGDQVDNMIYHCCITPHKTQVSEPCYLLPCHLSASLSQIRVFLLKKKIKKIIKIKVKVEQISIKKKDK
jgi:hypothetical protein